MKKILLFLFMCVSSFLIYENCSALEASEVNESNILEYFQENYSEYFNDYYFIFNGGNNYILMSFDRPINFPYTPSTGEFRIEPVLKDSSFLISQIWISKTDLSINKKNLLFNHPASTTISNFFIGLGDNSNYESTKSKFLYLNFDIYGKSSDVILFPKIVEPEPSPSPSPSPESTPTPDTPALPGDEGGVSANNVIKVYMKYFLMCLPVGLIMVMFEKFIEIIHNFILGKMRK